MKILMRADTHVSLAVPAEDPVAKCTFSQVNILKTIFIYMLLIQSMVCV